jgi:hypothetical protein
MMGMNEFMQTVSQMAPSGVIAGSISPVILGSPAFFLPRRVFTKPAERREFVYNIKNRPPSRVFCAAEQRRTGADLQPILKLIKLA